MTCASSEPGSGPRAWRARGYLLRLERLPFLTSHERETEAHGGKTAGQVCPAKGSGLGAAARRPTRHCRPRCPRGRRRKRPKNRGTWPRGQGQRARVGLVRQGKMPTHTSPRPWLLQGISFSVMEAETGILKFKSSSFYMPVSHMQPLELPVSLPRDLMSWCSPGLILGSRRRQGSPSKAVPAEDPAGPRSPRA